MPEKKEDQACRDILGSEAFEAFARGTQFLQEHNTPQLLELVGQTVAALRLTAEAADKRSFPASYGGGKPCDDDLLTGLGTFYLSQSGKVMLDCISGHYQMSWGYNHPRLNAAAAEAMQLGVVWDNHANTPSLPVKLLAEKLVSLVAGTGLDRIFLGACTGSVACETAFKIMLNRYVNDPARVAAGPPVMLALAGNYHGTSMTTQVMRGMWPGLLGNIECVQVEPNEPAGLEAAFAQYGARIAGFWAEPIMMNREVILVAGKFLQLARELCTEHGALMAIDEIQTGFWYPEVLMCRQVPVVPDLIILGKGMTAGFHPLAGVLYRKELDILEQYDSISTNGNASLAAFVALCNLRLLEQEHERLERSAQLYFNGLGRLAEEFPELIEQVNGKGFLAGLRFRDREDALGFHQAAVERGLWLRVHAYHPGHRTVLTKFALAVDQPTLEYFLDVTRQLLTTTPWR